MTKRQQLRTVLAEARQDERYYCELGLPALSDAARMRAEYAKLRLSELRGYPRARRNPSPVSL